MLKKHGIVGRYQLRRAMFGFGFVFGLLCMVLSMYSSGFARIGMDNVQEQKKAPIADNKHLNKRLNTQSNALTTENKQMKRQLNALTKHDKSRTTSADYQYGESRGSLGSVMANASASTYTLFLPPSEWLDDIDTNSSIVGCGVNKCAFHSRTSLLESRTNPDHRDRYGYVVADKDLAKAGGAFERAQELSKTFSIRHTLLADPIFVTNQHNDNLLYVQPTELYSKDDILFKCTEFEVCQAMESAKSLQYFSADVDPQAFEERLQLDLHKVEEVMDSQHGPCLSSDFQLVIDTITGTIIHIDFGATLDHRGGLRHVCKT